MDLIMAASENPACIIEMNKRLTSLYNNLERECDEDRESEIRWVENCKPFIYLKDRIQQVIGMEDVPKKEEILQVAEIASQATKIPFPTKCKRTRKSIYQWLDQHWTDIHPTLETIEFRYGPAME